VFETTYSAPASRVQERVWRQAFGDEYPEGVDPYSYVTASELRRFAGDLRVARGQTLVDLGCGRGGAGLWVALATGASLVGVDIAETALAAARERAATLHVEARFVRGEFEATGLGDGMADAVMSVDALLFTPDKAAAFRELRRIIGAGGRLCLTSWDYHRQPEGRPPQVPDHRPLAEAAGFRIVAYDETVRWRAHAEATGAGLLAAVEELAAETGADVEEEREGVEEMNATYEAMTRRFFLVAEAI
jgi:SAM-dependent methyltransferase